MIDASSFAFQHNAFWADHTPTCEHFVRRINVGHVSRWTVPLAKPSEEIRPAFVAELAFSRFCAKCTGIDAGEIMSFSLVETRKRLLPLFGNLAILEKPITTAELQQVSRLEANLQSFFEVRKLNIIARPIFNGCGYIDSSEGDIVSGKCLFEVKAVDRPFRSADVRQLLTYCALNHSSKQFALLEIGVYNPRRGIYFIAAVDEVAIEISGQPAQQLFDSIVHAISCGDISR